VIFLAALGVAALLCAAGLALRSRVIADRADDNAALAYEIARRSQESAARSSQAAWAAHQAAQDALVIARAARLESGRSA
jgi:hypothetical protein